MYKITVGPKTIVGTNEDAWRTESKVWFELGKAGEYNVCYTGSRKIGINNYAAQSGMNELGLVYSRLASHHPLKKRIPNTKLISDPDAFIKHVLHKCKNIKEVENYLNGFDLSVFIDDVFLFTEPSGAYLIIEPYSLSVGNDANYVLSNFCPSITSEKDRRKLSRYKNGVDFISKGTETSLSYCTNLSKAMHVCREKIGDGTLLTGIWDTDLKVVNLYFYHDYSKVVTFNLEEEFKKGNHMFDIPSLFSKNTEFEQLKTYVTPFNTPLLRIGIALLGLFFLFISSFFAINTFRGEWKEFRLMITFLSVFCLVLFGYMYVLATNNDIYYFHAPFVHFNNRLISLFSYTPYLLLLAYVPAVVFNKRIWRNKQFRVFPKIVVSTSTFAYTFLIGAFLYWRLF